MAKWQKENVFKFRIGDLLLIVPVLATFWQVVSNKYGHHNDYLYGVSSTVKLATNDFFSHPEALNLLIYGRPLNAILHDRIFGFVDAFDDLSLIRLCSVIVTAAACLVLHWFFTRICLFNYFLSIFILVGVICSPSILLFNYWASNFVPGTLAFLISTVAGVLIFQGVKYYQKNAEILGCFFLFAALLIYPPNAMFALIPTVTWWLFRRHQQGDIYLILRISLCFGLSILGFYLFIKAIYDPLLYFLFSFYPETSMNSGSYKFETISVNEIFRRIAGFYFLSVPHIFSIFVAKGPAILCWTLVLISIANKIYEERNSIIGLTMFLCGLLLLPLIFAMPLLAALDWQPGLRNLGPVFCFGFLISSYGLFALSQRLNFLKFFIPVIIACNIFSANQLLYRSISNQKAESNYVSDWIKNDFDPLKKYIAIKTMEPAGRVLLEKLYKPLPRVHSEFYLMASNYGFMPGIVEWQLRENTDNPEKVELFVNRDKIELEKRVIDVSSCFLHMKNNNGCERLNLLDFNKISPAFPDGIYDYLPQSHYYVEGTADPNTQLVEFIMKNLLQKEFSIE